MAVQSNCHACCCPRYEFDSPQIEGALLQGGGAKSDVWAGDFEGKLRASGDYYTSAGIRVTIDHRIDPESKTLSDATIQSQEMMHIYHGVVELDANGEASVELPEWFEALNRDFRYQLTCIGGFAPLPIALR